MKTAEEWLTEQQPRNIPSERRIIVADEAVIKAIQADARQSALKEAAEQITALQQTRI